MKLEDQLANLELSKKLKNLGVKQESLFFWCHVMKTVNLGWEIHNEYGSWGDEPCYSAFNSTELGEMLPKLSKCWNTRDNKWICEYMEPLRPDNMTFFTRTSIDASTEADARAKMLIYLIEEGIVKP